MSTDITETNALVILGDGYQLSVSPSAHEQKRSVLARTAAILTVTDAASLEIAQRELKTLSLMRNWVEKGRKAVKAPVIELGKQIDQTATEFLAELVTEEARVSGLAAEFVREEQRKAREAAEAAERERQRIAREEHELRMAEERKRMEAEQARMAAESEALEAQRRELAAERAKDEAAAEQARREAAAAAERAALAEREKHEAIRREQEAIAAARDQQRAVTESVAAPALAGVSEVIDFEVVDVAEFYAKFPQLCEVTVKRADVLHALKRSFTKNGKLPEVAGLRVFHNTKVRGR
jgi:chromosome segregation ATPase